MGRHDLDRPAEQAAGAVELVVADAEIKAGGELDGGVGADHDGDPTPRQAEPGVGAVGEEAVGDPVAPGGDETGRGGRRRLAAR